MMQWLSQMSFDWRLYSELRIQFWRLANSSSTNAKVSAAYLQDMFL